MTSRAHGWQPWRISLFFAAYFAGVGVLAPYFPLYLSDRGLTAVQIGIVMAVAQGMRIFGPTAWGWLADRTTERERILRFTSAAAVVCFLPVLFPGGFGTLLLTMFAVHFFLTGQVPMVEAMAATRLRGDPRAARTYGRLRVWGSVSFVVTVLATGFLLDWAGVAVHPWAVLAFFIATAVAAHVVHDAPHAPHVDAAVSLRDLFGQPRVRWFFLSVLLMIFAHGALYTYFSLHLAALGYSKGEIGAFWVLGVLIEICFFLVQGRVFERFEPFDLLSASFALAALRFALIAEAAQVVVLLALAQALHAATFAVHHSASILTIQRWFHGRATARGQALYVSIGYGVGGTAGSLLAAWLWSAFGASAAFLSSSIAALLGWLAVRRAREHDAAQRGTAPGG